MSAIIQARVPAPGQHGVLGSTPLVFNLMGAIDLPNVLVDVTWEDGIPIRIWENDAVSGGWSGTHTDISGGYHYELTPPGAWPVDETCEVRVQAREGGAHLLAVSSAGKQLYIRRSSGWEAFSIQPTWGAGAAAKICLGLPNGNIIVNRRTGGSEWCHYTRSAGAWDYKAKVQVGGGTEVHGFVYDSTHVYVAEDNARVDKFDGADWSTLTASALSPVSVGPYHVAATAADRVWYATGGNGYDAANSSLLYFNGSTWANRISEARTALGLNYRAYVTQLHAVGGVLYCGWADYYEDGNLWHCRVSKLVGSTWSLLGAGYMANTLIDTNMTGLFAISESSVWALGINNTAKMVVAHWNGSAWSSQDASCSTTTNTPVAQQIFGTSTGLNLLAVNAADDDRIETTNGTTWAAPTWPDGNTVQSLGATTEFGGELDTSWGFEVNFRTVRVPLGGLYIDHIREQLALTSAVVLNQIPEDGETGVPINDLIRLHVVNPGREAGDMLVASVKVYVTRSSDEVRALAYDQAGTGFQTGFNGARSSATYQMSPGSVVFDELLLAIDHEPWTSLEVITVEVEGGIAE